MATSAFGLDSQINILDIVVAVQHHNRVQMAKRRNGVVAIQPEVYIEFKMLCHGLVFMATSTKSMVPWGGVSALREF